MPIVQAEIKFYKSATVNDTTSNGGRMSSNEIADGAASNLFAAVSQSERVAGSTKYRKLFIKIANDSELVLGTPHVFLDKNTPGGDRVTFFPGTQIDLQSAITGSERQYGGGTLNANVSGGATSMSVLVEEGTVTLFQNGDTVRITDKADVDAAGNEEYVVISGAPGVVGNVVTFNFAPALQNGYSTSNTRVQSCYMPGDVGGIVDNLVVTSAGDGDFNPVNLLPDAIGGVEQTWTLTFTGATTFSIVGDTVGSVGTGTTGGGAAPNNPAFTKPYFVMQAVGFTGTWQAGDTIVFQTHAAAIPVWLKRVVPPGTAANASNTATLAVDGETA